MKNLIKKFSSRKFLIAVSGVASGLVLIVSGNVTEGVTAIVASVVAYLAAEGYIDAKAIKLTQNEECTMNNAE